MVTFSRTISRCGARSNSFGRTPATCFFQIDEDNYHRQLVSGFDQSRRVDVIAAVEACDGVESARAGDFFTAQHLQNLLPLVGLVQIHRYIDSRHH
jgi:hypothetical protein